jgi:hypothetical protein
MFSFFSKRRAEAFEALACLSDLQEEGDPDSALTLVAEASAHMLPAGDRLADDYLQNPPRHFGIQEARAGSVDGVRAELIWTKSDVSSNMTGGVSASSGSPNGSTYAFAELPVSVPVASLYPRPRRVPVSAGGGIGDPELDPRYLVAAEDPFHSLPGPVRSVLVECPPRSFGWFVVWGRHACAHSIDPPGSDAQGDRLIELVVKVARAFA